MHLLDKTIYAILNLIHAAADPVAIYQLGTTGQEQNTHYFFLVLVPPSSNTSYQAMESAIENAGPDLPARTIIIKSINHANQQIALGNRFFINYCTGKYCLYDNCRHPIITFNGEPLLESHDALIVHFLAKSEAFAKGAAYFSKQNDFAMSAFMLHQATELVLTAAILATAGYKNYTHNLRKLFRYTSLWVPEINNFEGNSEEEQRQFNLLQAAYNNRYNTSYQIYPADLENLTYKFNELMQVVRSQICQIGQNSQRSQNV